MASQTVVASPTGDVLDDAMESVTIGDQKVETAIQFDLPPPRTTTLKPAATRQEEEEFNPREKRVTFSLPPPSSQASLAQASLAKAVAKGIDRSSPQSALNQIK